MLRMIHTSLILLVICSQISTAVAQPRGFDLPREQDLNQYDLTMMWWGRAVVDPSRDTVLFLTNDEQNVYMQASSGIVTTYSGESGRKLWANLIGLPDQVGYPAASNDEQLLISVGLKVYSLDKTTGTPLWELHVPDHPSAAPEVDDHQIYIGTVDGSVFSYDLHRIQKLNASRMLPQWTARARMWRFKTPTEIVSTPIALGSTLTFASTQGILYGVGTVDKGLKFEFETNGRVYTPLGYSQKYVFIADNRSRMYCLNKDNGRINWTFSSGAPILQQPRAVGKRVYAVPQREGLVSLSVASGRVLWQQIRATEFLAASEERVYASDLSGNLLILDKEDGAIIGTIPMRGFSLRVNNDRTDRIVMSTPDGLAISLREKSAEFPVFHLHPDRQPIMPLFASEAEEMPADAPATPENPADDVQN